MQLGAKTLVTQEADDDEHRAEGSSAHLSVGRLALHDRAHCALAVIDCAHTHTHGGRSVHRLSLPGHTIVLLAWQ